MLDRAGGDDEGGGELEGRNPPNPSNSPGALPLGVDWDASQSASCSFGGLSVVVLSGCFIVASNKNQWVASISQKFQVETEPELSNRGMMSPRF